MDPSHLGKPARCLSSSLHVISAPWSFASPELACDGGIVVPSESSLSPVGLYLQQLSSKISTDSDSN